MDEGQRIKCEVCRKTGLNAKAGLTGHKKIVQGVETKKTLPNGIEKRLDVLQKHIAENMRVSERGCKIA